MNLNEITDKLNNLLPELNQDLQKASTTEDLDEVRVTYLGKKGRLTSILKSFGQLEPSDRPRAGKAVNEIKEKVIDLISRKAAKLQEKEILQRIETEKLDITLPGVTQSNGRLHPITQVLHEIEDVFETMGFEIETGPDIEDDYHNFEALNIPPEHPARDMHDTFYVRGGYVLRTHTSPVQIRVMQKKKPPLAIIAPGSVYRVDQDVSHSPMFVQVEGLMVDENISFGDLKGVLAEFVHRQFGPEIDVRFRPSFFPFTEPSAEMDIECVLCGGEGCGVCKKTGWLEIMGCGMVHPAVFENVGYNPEEVTGFAFGMGVDRIAMLKFGIDNIRLFYENDIRFLSQF